MRKSLALSLVVALFAESPISVGLRAQSARSTTVGVIGGAATTTMMGKDAADDLERRRGVLGGLSVVFSGSSAVQLEIDGLYATKGFRSSGSSSAFNFTAGYVEVPVLLRLRLASGARVVPFVAAGPAFGMRIACSAEQTAPTGTANVSCGELERAWRMKIGKSDVSGVLGAGVELPIGSLQGTLATRYTRGFSSVIGELDNHFQAVSFYVGLSRARRK